MKYEFEFEFESDVRGTHHQCGHGSHTAEVCNRDVISGQVVAALEELFHQAEGLENSVFLVIGDGLGLEEEQRKLRPQK